MEFLTSFLGRSGYLPHGYCFTWTPGLLWSMAVSDVVIATTYFTIPVAIMTFVRKRADPSLVAVAWLLSAFIFACGTTHVMDVWTIWVPDYGLHAVTKIMTAAISIAATIALWQLIPKALKIPTVTELQRVIASLEAEVRARRGVEDHLAEIQQSLAVTLASIEAGFIATDRAGGVTRMNAVAEKVTGWTQAEAQGQGLWTVFNREDRPDAFLSMNPVDVTVEQGFNVETVRHLRAISRSGVRTDVEIKAAPTYARDGSVRGLAMVFRDMTRLIRAEAESTRLAAIVESSNDAIIGMSLDGHITSWNGAAEAMFGYHAEEAIGKPVQMLIPQDRQAETMHVLANIAQGSVTRVLETVHLAKNGNRLEASVTASPIRNAQGVVIGVSKIVRDVSLQRLAEAALRASEEQLRFTLEAGHIGEWNLDLITGEAIRSIRHDRCFGYGVLQPKWNFDIFITHVHPDDRPEVIRQYRVATKELTDLLFECRVIWPDASVHWIRGHGSVQRANGIGTRMLGIVTDITQQKQAEASRLTALRLEAENRQIQEANRLKSQFLANMSHELRTPLNAVIGFADLLYAGVVKPESPKHHEFLGHIATSGRHLLRLINDVLDLSKVESGKFEFFPVPVNLLLLVKEVKDILHTAIQRKHITTAVDIDPTLCELELDPARLKQVLYNYLSNAIKFTHEGGQVTLRARAEGAEHFRIEIEDDGIGITESDLARLFVDFQQLDAGHSKQHQGTGLGLALTRRLVEAQGGRVGVRSTLGRGSVSYLVLARVHRPDAGPSAQALPAPFVKSSGRRLLVIEPEQRDQTLLVDALSKAGFRADAAASGEAALQQAQDTTYDAITLDLVLPDQRGLDVLASIRSGGPSRGSPVVGVSMRADTEKSVNFAIADVLRKPVRIDEIAAAMARIRVPEKRRAKVMVIDDDPTALDLMRETLRDLRIDAVCMLSGLDALREIEFTPPDAIILDLTMPEFDGFAVLDALRRLPAAQNIPVFIWTSTTLTDDEYASLARSARVIVSHGGGALATMVDAVCGPRPATTTPITPLRDRGQT